MQFELTKEYIERVDKAIEEQNNALALELVEELYPADIAEVMSEMELNHALALYKLLDEEVATDVFVELDEQIRERFLSAFTPEEIAREFDRMDSDDAADVIAELPEDAKDEILSKLENVEQASDIVDLLNYDEDTAGGLMAKELIKVNINWGIPKCISEIRKQAEEVDEVYMIYVVDDDGKLEGSLSLKNLLISPENTSIRSILESDVIAVRANTSSEDVANIMKKYDLVVLPVIDQIGRLLGRITIDDVVDVMREEAEKDYQMASGLSERVESTDKIWILSRARLPWLLIGLLGGVLGARVIETFEGDLQIYPEMAFFIPLIAAMGGNVGVQSSAIIVQGLANKTLGIEGLASKLFKELGVAMINGLICSLLILSYTIIFDDSMNLSFTVSSSLLVVIVFASIFGTLVPLTLDRMKIDPALATGPFITTVNDILGLFLYFLIGRLLYV